MKGSTSNSEVEVGGGSGVEINVIGIPSLGEKNETAPKGSATLGKRTLDGRGGAPAAKDHRSRGYGRNAASSLVPYRR